MVQYPHKLVIRFSPLTVLLFFFFFACIRVNREKESPTHVTRARQLCYSREVCVKTCTRIGGGCYFFKCKLNERGKNGKKDARQLCQTMCNNWDYYYNHVSRLSSSVGVPSCGIYSRTRRIYVKWISREFFFAYVVKRHFERAVWKVNFCRVSS